MKGSGSGRDGSRIDIGCNEGGVQGSGNKGRVPNEYWSIGRVELAAANSRRLAVGVMRRNFREGIPASAQRLIAGLVRNVPVTTRRAVFWIGSSKLS